MDEIEDAFDQNRLTTDHMASPGQWPLGNISFVAFAGEDMLTIYLGSLQAPHLFSFKP